MDVSVRRPEKKKLFFACAEWGKSGEEYPPFQRADVIVFQADQFLFAGERTLSGFFLLLRRRCLQRG